MKIEIKEYESGKVKAFCNLNGEGDSLQEQKMLENYFSTDLKDVLYGHNDGHAVKKVLEEVKDIKNIEMLLSAVATESVKGYIEMLKRSKRSK